MLAPRFVGPAFVSSWSPIAWPYRLARLFFGWMLQALEGRSGQAVSHLVPLRLEVATVHVVGGRLQGDPFDDLETVYGVGYRWRER